MGITPIFESDFFSLQKSLEKSLNLNGTIENTSIYQSEKKITRFTLGKIVQCEWTSKYTSTVQKTMVPTFSDCQISLIFQYFFIFWYFLQQIPRNKFFSSVNVASTRVNVCINYSIFKSIGTLTSVQLWHLKQH